VTSVAKLVVPTTSSGCTSCDGSSAHRDPTLSLSPAQGSPYESAL